MTQAREHTQGARIKGPLEDGQGSGVSTDWLAT